MVAALHAPPPAVVILFVAASGLSSHADAAPQESDSEEIICTWNNLKYI